jgi:hypothetical protein
LDQSFWLHCNVSLFREETAFRSKLAHFEWNFLRHTSPFRLKLLARDWMDSEAEQSPAADRLSDPPPSDCGPFGSSSDQCVLVSWAVEVSQRLDDHFEITARGSSLSTELIAGLSVFLTISRLIFTNATLLGTDSARDPCGSSRQSSLFIPTRVGLAVGSVLMSAIARVPLVLSPGMPWLSTFAMLILYGDEGAQWTFDNVMAIGFIAGIIALIAAVAPAGHDGSGAAVQMCERIINSIPTSVRRAIPAGIGLFNVFVGLTESNVIVRNEQTLIAAVDFAKMTSDDPAEAEA